MQKKTASVLFVVLALLLVTAGAALVVNEILLAKRPTGYPSGTVQFEYLFHDGTRYTYYAGEGDQLKELPLGYRLVGEVGKVDNTHLPQSEMEASRLQTGMKVYAQEDGAADHLYVFFAEQELYHRLVPERS